MAAVQAVCDLPSFCFDAQNNGGALGASVDGCRLIDFSAKGPEHAQSWDAGFTLDQCAAFTARLSSFGVRAYLPTLITADPLVLRANLDQLARFRETRAGAHCPGIHLEACFFTPADGYTGAHPAGYCVSGAAEPNRRGAAAQRASALKALCPAVRIRVLHE